MARPDMSRFCNRYLRSLEYRPPLDTKVEVKRGCNTWLVAYVKPTPVDGQPTYKWGFSPDPSDDKARWWDSVTAVRYAKTKIRRQKHGTT